MFTPSINIFWTFLNESKSAMGYEFLKVILFHCYLQQDLHIHGFKLHLINNIVAIRDNENNCA